MNNVVPCVVIAKVGDICFYGVEISEDYALKMDKDRFSAISDSGTVRVGGSVLEAVEEITTAEKKVVKRDNAWCVVRHDTGEPIKCFNISEYGEAGARKRAYALLSAIEHGGEEQ